MIRAVHLAFRSDTTLFEDVSLQVDAAECVALSADRRDEVTALMQVLAGWRQPRAGAIRLGDGAHAADAQTLRRAVAYAPAQPIATNGLRVDEYLRFVARVRGAQLTPSRVTDAAARVRLDPAACIAALSTADRTSLSIAAALLVPAEVVLIERIDAVPSAAREGVTSWLAEVRDRGIAMIVGTDDSAVVAALCRRVARLQGGCLTQTTSVHEMRDLAGRRHLASQGVS